MKYSKWLQGVKNCPDEWVSSELGRQKRITHDFGIYSNWPILTNFNLDDFERELLSIGFKDMKYKSRQKDEVVVSFERNNIPWALKKADIFFAPYFYYPNNPVINVHRKAQEKYCSVFYTPSADSLKENAESIELVCDFLMKREIGFCLPNSIGWSHVVFNSKGMPIYQNESLKRIVYWPDKDEERIIQEAREMRERR